LLGLLLIWGVQGCTLPSSFFRPRVIEEARPLAAFEVQTLDAHVLDKMPRNAHAPDVSATFLDAPPSNFDQIDVDDRLTVAMYEPGTGVRTVLGSGGRTELLTNAQVDASGMLNIPYVGPIKAQGLTVEQLRQQLHSRLKRVVLDPQIQVSLGERASKLVTVQGLASKGGRYPLDRGTQRLSHLLAQVAPDQKNPEMLQILLRRNSLSARMRLAEIYNDPRLDVHLHAGDSIFLSEVVQNVSVLGAVNVQGQLRIPRRQFSVLDAIALARGMNEDRADPSAVFLFRQSEIETRLHQRQKPVVYRIDLSQPEVLLLARQVQVSDNDVLLIGDASFTDVRKVAASLNAILTGTTRLLDLATR
jgi:polysaccharide export outer membrane protein